MRFVVSAGLLVSLIASPAAAGSIVSIEFRNANLYFGLTDSKTIGTDVEWVEVDGLRLPEFINGGGFYDAFSGPFIQQTLQMDVNGTVIGSEYSYSGGTFNLCFTEGCFAAPLISHRVRTLEPSGPAEAVYQLGPGVFDESLARAFGVGRRTLGGDLYSLQGPFPPNWGDYTSRDRQAYNEDSFITLQVPEPSVLILGSLGFAAACVRRRLGLWR